MSGWDDVEFPLGYREIDLTHAYKVEKIGMQSLEVDGNVPENMQVFNDQVNYDPRLQEALYKTQMRGMALHPKG